MTDFHELLVDAGMAPKDGRVYLIIDMANAVLAGQDLTPEHRENLAEFPYTLQLLDRMAAGRGNGSSRVHATPGPDATAETFAKAWLAMDWELEHGHSYRTEIIDPMCGWRRDARAMRRMPYVRWRRIPAWIGDRAREGVMKVRIFWNRKVLRVVNPYD